MNRVWETVAPLVVCMLVVENRFKLSRYVGKMIVEGEVALLVAMHVLEVNRLVVANFLLALTVNALLHGLVRLDAAARATPGVRAL
jgi:hypothetical protein